MKKSDFLLHVENETGAEFLARETALMARFQADIAVTAEKRQRGPSNHAKTTAIWPVGKVDAELSPLIDAVMLNFGLEKSEGVADLYFTTVHERAQRAALVLLPRTGFTVHEFRENPDGTFDVDRYSFQPTQQSVAA